MSAAEHATLDYAELWLRDGLTVLRPAFSASQVTVDMTRALARLDELRRQKVPATPTHLLVHAVAAALAANPALHQVVAGRHRYRPGRVDIGLSVAGESFVAPVMVIEGAELKSIAELADETRRRAPEVREADQRMLKALRRWGALMPFGFLRRAVLRVLFSQPVFRSKGAGTFQVSVVPADWALTSSFSASGVLFGGQVWSRVVAIEGEPVVRPVMTLTLCADHGAWDGAHAARFLAHVKSTLEGPPVTG
jgi:pyruvate dehydrogenase E2 component (dihydrolipoamide acetyltransferase)